MKKYFENICKEKIYIGDEIEIQTLFGLKIVKVVEIEQRKDFDDEVNLKIQDELGIRWLPVYASCFNPKLIIRDVPTREDGMVIPKTEH